PRLRQQGPVRGPELAVFLEEPVAGDIRPEGDQLVILRRGHRGQARRAAGDGVVDRRRPERALEADEGSREPGVEEGRRQGRVEQARLAGADPGAGAGGAAREGGLAGGGAGGGGLERVRAGGPG